MDPQVRTGWGAPRPPQERATGEERWIAGEREERFRACGGNTTYSSGQKKLASKLSGSFGLLRDEGGMEWTSPVTHPHAHTFASPF